MAKVDRLKEMREAIKLNPLARLRKESSNAYRSFLLWAMQMKNLILLNVICIN